MAPCSLVARGNSAETVPMIDGSVLSNAYKSGETAHCGGHNISKCVGIAHCEPRDID